MRKSFLVCYDISDDKRLRKVFQTMRGYGDHLQYSIFECQLTSTDLVRLRFELSATSALHTHILVLAKSSGDLVFPDRARSHFARRVLLRIRPRAQIEALHPRLLGSR